MKTALNRRVRCTPLADSEPPTLEVIVATRPISTFSLRLDASVSGFWLLGSSQDLYGKRDALWVDDEEVSRRHAQLFWSSGELSVEDLGSTNGTFLNGLDIRGRGRCRILPRQTVYLGKSSVHYRWNISSSLSHDVSAPDIDQLRKALGDLNQDIVVDDPQSISVYWLLFKYAQTNRNLLICGESGTGKDVAASAVHKWSSRGFEKMILLNCAQLPRTLETAALFGYKRGSFTGAVMDTPGYFETAHKSTLFLDEIGELSLEAQGSLLRVLEEPVVTRIGDTRDRSVDVRIIFATNRNLREEVSRGRFKPDLLSRIEELCVSLPPLAQRPAEIPLLAQRFLRELCAKDQRRGITFAPDALRWLQQQAWPNNARGIRNLIGGALPLVGEGTEISVSALVREQQRRQSESLTAPLEVNYVPSKSRTGPLSMRKQSEEINDYIQKAHARGESFAMTAEHLDITSQAVFERAKRMGLTKLRTRRRAQ